MDNPMGVVHKRDVADLLLSGKSLDLEALVREPIFIPDTSSLLKAMEQFRASRTHIAFVINEFGGFEGLLTLTDLMEMIAGDFNEAHDDDRKMVMQREDGSWLVDGRTDLVDLGLALDDDFESEGGYHTVAGMILHELERFPKEGETLTIGAYQVEIIDMDERRIDKVVMKKA
jgi:putative hemolysin